MMDQAKAKQVVSAAVALAPYPSWVRLAALRTALDYIDGNPKVAQAFIAQVREILK